MKHTNHINRTSLPHARQWRILAVDDDEDMQFLHSQALAGAGYNLTTVGDGEAAWAALMTEHFDLLLADHNMPGLCGLDLVARMRAAGMTLPVIINSGCPDLGDATAYPHLDLAAVLQKSFRFTELVAAVQRVLPLPQDAAAASFATCGREPAALGLAANQR
jgi:DNA-binding NtrC family response regulator